ncbi:hypothetical protein [Spiroplasma sp. DGKH1]|uniref:hypothetical protein n=1 Tax=Spiroplasma sp. DGKH1 TaxID=3050074 RepID=UPI0034C6C015
MKTLLTFLGSSIIGATSVASGTVQIHENNITTNNVTNGVYSFDVSDRDDYIFGWHWQDSSTFNNNSANINYHWGSKTYHGGLDYTTVDMTNAPVSEQWEQYKTVYLFSRDVFIGLAEVRMFITMDYHKGYDGKYNIRYHALNSKTDWSGSYAHFWGSL